MYDYSTTPIEYAKPRDTEAAVYEFVATEMDEVKEALDIAPQGSSLLTRATKASALALKSRAMLYAGTLAYNEDKSKTMGLTLTSGAVGISKNKATEYLQSCIDAYLELKEIGRYSLLKVLEAVWVRTLIMCLYPRRIIRNLFSFVIMMEVLIFQTILQCGIFLVLNVQLLILVAM